jgi:hypothetical protein
VAGSAEIEWSQDAVADLDRFAASTSVFPISGARIENEVVGGLAFSADIRTWDGRSQAARSNVNSSRHSVVTMPFSTHSVAAGAFV